MREDVIFHNPRCSKSRAALALLEEHGAAVRVVHYLEAPPSVEDLGFICKSLGVRPVEIVRAKEAAFRELGLARDDDRSDAEWLRLMVEHPILIERPLVVVGGRAILGRPPENVLALLEGA